METKNVFVCVFCGCECKAVALCWECSDRMNGCDEVSEEEAE